MYMQKQKKNQKLFVKLLTESPPLIDASLFQRIQKNTYIYQNKQQKVNDIYSNLLKGKFK